VQEPFGDLFDDLPTSRGMRCIRKDLLDTPIATVMDAERASRLYLDFMREPEEDRDAAAFDAALEACVLEHGMNKAQIEAAFPPNLSTRSQSDITFNRTALMATIIWQEWKRVGRLRPKGNIRHFWYTHLMYTLTRVMNDTEIRAIFSTYSRVLKNLIREEGFQYADLNFVSTKSKLCEAMFADSPYPNLILACEKESYHQYLKHLAHVFRVTFISLGGQGSYGVYEDLVFQLMGADIALDQEFKIFVITDFDPQDYKIQETAKEHLERAGIRRVTIERVYLGPEHLTPGIHERFAVPYEVKKSTVTATKAAASLYNWFGAKTGGIYKRGGEWMTMARNGDGTYHVPQLVTGDEGYEVYRVELDNFKEGILINLLIDALDLVVNGAEYYYAAANVLWRDTIKRLAVDAARSVIWRAVKAKTQPVEQALDELRARMAAIWSELTADEHTIIAKVREDYDTEYESIQDRINEIQEEIDALREEQTRLGNQQWEIRETADDIMNFLRAVQRTVVPDIPAAQQRLAPVDAQLRAYREAQEEAQTEPVANRFTVEPENIRRVVNCENRANVVFERARAGAETFTAELSYFESSHVTSAARSNLEDQQEAMTVDVPDLPADTIDDINQRVRDANDLLDQADRTGNLSGEWEELRQELVDHYMNDDLSWDPWEDWDNGAWQDDDVSGE
jgi:hypothetical protein